ncbi:hypothetical protein BGZ76_001396 [Entomortierella beljakovae]|nr:hypothetical protein BGZ76_001396 [Entomortierella beljakovae]
MAMSTRSMSQKSQTNPVIVPNSHLSNVNDESRQMNPIKNEPHSQTFELSTRCNSSQANLATFEGKSGSESLRNLLSERFNLDPAALVRLLSQPTKDKRMDENYINQNMTDSTMYRTGRQQTKARRMNSPDDMSSGDSSQFDGSPVSTTVDSPSLSTIQDVSYNKRMSSKKLPQLMQEPFADLSVVEPFSDMHLDSPASTTSTFSPDTFLNDSSEFLTSEPLFSTENFFPPLSEEPSYWTAANINGSDVDDLNSYFPVSASAVSQKRRKARKHAVCVPRPKNCFMLYRSKVLPMIMAELGAINNKIISKIAAERWRAEPEAVKSWYRTKARQGKEEHAKNNPGYRYAPHKRQLNATSPNATPRDLARRNERRPSNERDRRTVKAAKGDKNLYSDHMQIIDDDDVSNGFGLATKRRPWKKLPRQNKPKSCKRTKLDDDDIFPFAGLFKDDNGFTSSKRHRSKRTLGFKDDQGSQKKHQSNDTQSGQNLHRQPTTIGDGSYPNKSINFGMHSRFEPAPSSIPSKGSSIDQQLSLEIQRNYQKLLQQQQQLQVSFLNAQVRVQAQPVASHSLASGQAPSTNSLYNMTAGGNSSTCTLVDPVNNWMTQNYHSDSLFGGVSNQDSTLNGLNSKQPASACNGNFLDNAGILKLMEKDLPPLPQDQPEVVNDPNFLLSQLYTQYNSNQSWEQPLSFQDFPIQLYETKEPEPAHGLSTISLAGSTSITQWSSIPDNPLGEQFYHNQPLHQKEGKEDQGTSQSQYLIKPASSTGYMSFTDIGYGSKSMMDMLFLPDPQQYKRN